MAGELRILVVEDCAADVVLINHVLRDGGLAFRSKRVDNQADFVSELLLNPPDLILSDHGLPEFDGFTALAIAQNQCPGTPFIFVSGAPQVEVVIEALKCGATDFLLKDRLATRLVPAVREAVGDAGGRLRSRPAEAELETRIHELETALAEVKALKELVLVCSACEQIRDEQGCWQALDEYWQAHPRATLTRITCPECAQARFLEPFERD